MKFRLHIYVAQPQKGHYRASIPFVDPLAPPIEGSSPAQLKEELMFRMLELIHGGLNPAQLDTLLGVQSAQMLDTWVEVVRTVHPARPAVVMTAWVHMVAGRRPNDDLVHVWVPSAPGECFAVEHLGEVYDAARVWAEQWAETHDANDLLAIATEFPARLEAMDVDLGFPAADPHRAENVLAAGRFTRPEVLAQVATNLTHHADDDTLRRAYGRRRLVDELVEVMTATNPAHVCLVGPPGSGKTAVLEEAVRQVFELQRAYHQRRDVWQTSGDRIIAGMSIIGQWEQRVEAICHELDARQDILVVDDLLGLVRAGRTYEGDSSVARFIEPYLDQGRFSIIAEANEHTFEAARAEAPGFVDRFRRIQVPGLDRAETLSILNELVRALEAQQRVRFSPDAVEAIVGLSARFFRQEAFPGKAVRLGRQCFSAAVRALSDAQEFEARVDPELVARVVHQHTRLPMRLLVPGQGRAPEEVERAFNQRVFEQPEASRALTSLIVATEQGLNDPKRPLGSFLLIGPSGVGKTETARALALDLFGARDRLVRFDMSEFATPSAATRLIGTVREPDGELTGRVRIQPFCVLLFDEIEKAHPMVLDLLLQLLGDGRLTDAAGRTVDFTNTVVLMTSNLGAGSESRWLGFSEKSDTERGLHYRRAAQQFFRPELFNRIDQILAYQPLTMRALRRIAQRTLRELLARRGLRQGRVMVDVAPALIAHLVGDAPDPRYGARTLAHRVEQRLITPLARALADHDPDAGLTRVILNVDAAGALALDLVQLADAAYITRRPRGVQLFVDHVDGSALDQAHERLRARLAYLVDGLARLEQGAAYQQIEGEYDQALAELNRRAAHSPDAPRDAAAGELVEGLGQREAFRQLMRRLRRRLDGLVDPEQTGQQALPELEHMDKSTLRRWDERVDELYGRLVWARTQAHALSQRPVDAGTLLVRGLSGGFAEWLQHWQAWLRGFARRMDIQLTEAAQFADGWHDLNEMSAPGVGAGADFSQVTALAFSGEHPGIRALFEALRGYWWAPQPASHGDHGLILISTDTWGTSDATQLVARLDSDLDFASDSGASRVEFIVRDSQLAQPALGSRASLPATRAAAARFAERLFFARLAAAPGAEHPSASQPSEQS